MELIAGDVEVFHLGFADLDTLAVIARVECALDFQLGLGRRGADQLDDGRRLVSGRPRQFCVMWQNSRCSILFHFDVPRRFVWTRITCPVSSASFCNSTFPSRTRAVRRNRKFPCIRIARPMHFLGGGTRQKA